MTTWAFVIVLLNTVFVAVLARTRPTENNATLDVLFALYWPLSFGIPLFLLGLRAVTPTSWRLHRGVNTWVGPKPCSCSRCKRARAIANEMGR